MRLTREVRSFYTDKAKDGDWGAIVVASGAALIVLALAVMLLLIPFVEHVGTGEIVVCETSSGGDKDVEIWRGDKDPGFHWQGFCKVTTYHRSDTRKFKEPLVADGAHYAVRGKATFRLALDDAQLLEMHRAYGSEDALYARHVLPKLRETLQAAAADPDWAAPKGNIVERKLKGALEYGLKRISPTGHIWTSPEARQELEKELNRRLKASPGSADIPVEVTLGFVTER